MSEVATPVLDSLLKYIIEIDETNRPLNVEDLADEKYLFLNKADFSSCNFSRFPTILGRFRALEYLKLSNNLIVTCEISGKMPFLKELYLNANNLKEYPESVNELKSLKLLDLSINEFSTIPSSIKKLSNLVKLDMSRNSIETLPNGLFEIKTLKYLNLSNNEIREVPLQASKINLYQLNLSCNKIKFVPKEARNLERITLFDVTFNPIEYPPQSMIKRGSKGFLQYLKDEEVIEKAQFGLSQIDLNLGENEFDEENYDEIVEEPIAHYQHHHYTNNTRKLQMNLRSHESFILPIRPNRILVDRSNVSNSVNDLDNALIVTNSSNNNNTNNRINDNSNNNGGSSTNLNSVQRRQNQMDSMYREFTNGLTGKPAIQGIDLRSKLSLRQTRIDVELNRNKFTIMNFLSRYCGRNFSTYQLDTLIHNGDIFCDCLFKINPNVINMQKVHYGISIVEVHLLIEEYAISNLNLFMNGLKKMDPSFKEFTNAIDDFLNANLSAVNCVLAKIDEYVDANNLGKKNP